METRIVRPLRTHKAVTEKRQRWFGERQPRERPAGGHTHDLLHTTLTQLSPVSCTQARAAASAATTTRLTTTTRRPALPPRRSAPKALRPTTRTRVISPPNEETPTVTAPLNPLDRAPDALPSAFLPPADPWTDPKWAGVQWTVYRGVAYDLTGFLRHHPAGAWLVRLGLGRDATALFESYHLRPEVAAARLRRLPVLEGFPVHAVPQSPRPNDSDLYNTLRARVRAEVFKGSESQGTHRSGAGPAIAAVLGAAVGAYALYALSPGAATGALLGLAGAWIGLTVQHCGNHGAMSTTPWVNVALGAGDDLIGGSSLAWQYHHQVSHHIHCNDDAFDEDVFSSFPLLRFDARQPRAWYHAYQHVYMWALFPFMQLAFQAGDWSAILQGRTAGATMHGASVGQRAAGAAGKLAHYFLLIGVPALTHGWAATAAGAAAFVAVQGLVLATTFAVSHNVPETKPSADGLSPASAPLLTDVADRDWGLQQVATSANYGGAVANFMTGGLSLQVEHHLFPAVFFGHYPAISAIVADECAKRGIPYAQYPTLWATLKQFVRYMRDVGRADEMAVVPCGSLVGGEALAARAAQLARF